MQFKIGDTLPNGAKILSVRTGLNTTADVLVLCYWEQHSHPFVTWRVDNEGNCFWGSYHKDVQTATDWFEKRTIQ